MHDQPQCPQTQAGVPVGAPPISAPSAWVARFAPLVAPMGRVLDVACGGGRHLRLFQRRGHPVVGVDIDLAGVADLQGVPGVTLRQADLETPAPEPGETGAGATGAGADAPAHHARLRAVLGQDHAGVVVCNYLHRPLLGLLAASLAPGGVLLYETFAQGHERLGRPTRPDFLLAPGELLALCAATGLTVIAYECGEVATPRPAVVQRLAAWRAPADGALPPPLSPT